MSLLDENGVYCFRPQQWARVIGWLQIVGTVLLGVIVTAVIMAPLLITVSDPPNGANEQDNQQFYRFVVFGIVTLWALVGLSILIAAMLLIGNEQEQTGFLWPWLVLSWIDTVFTGVGLTVALFTGQGWLVLYLAVDILAGGFFLYVVHERRKEILDAQR